MPMALSSSTCITLSEGPQSTDIDSEQAQQELNVLRALTLADISMERTNVFNYSYMSLVNYRSTEVFWCKNEA